jgi:hypothetical protein
MNLKFTVRKSTTLFLPALIIQQDLSGYKKMFKDIEGTHLGKTISRMLREDDLEEFFKQYDINRGYKD